MYHMIYTITMLNIKYWLFIPIFIYLFIYLLVIYLSVDKNHFDLLINKIMEILHFRI